MLLLALTIVGRCSAMPSNPFNNRPPREDGRQGFYSRGPEQDCLAQHEGIAQYTRLTEDDAREVSLDAAPLWGTSSLSGWHDVALAPQLPR